MKKIFFILSILTLYNTYAMHHFFQHVTRGDLRQLISYLEIDLNKINEQDAYGQTALHKSITTKNIEMFKYLLEKKANINVKDSSGDTPLHKAIYYCSKEPSENNCFFQIIEELLENKDINVDLQNRVNDSPLLAALTSEWKNTILKYLVIIKLLEKGADINFQDCVGQTACMLVLKKEEPYVFNILFDIKKINVNLSDIYGTTLLHWAIYKGYKDLVLKFIEIGADVNAKYCAKNDDYYSALYLATDKNFKDIEQILRDAGAKE